MYARAYKYFFFKSHLKKKFLVAVIHFFEKLTVVSSKFTFIYVSAIWYKLIYSFFTIKVQFV